jgi:hypothetical protein
VARLAKNHYLLGSIKARISGRTHYREEKGITFEDPDGWRVVLNEHAEFDSIRKLATEAQRHGEIKNNFREQI